MRLWPLLFLAVSALAGEVKLVWDQNPPSDSLHGYYLYERKGDLTALDTNAPLSSTNWTVTPIDHVVLKFIPISESMVLTNGNWELLSNVNTTVEMPVGPHVFVVTATNFFGESVFSNPASTVVRPYPSVPNELRIEFQPVPTNQTALLTFTNLSPDMLIQHSENLVQWRDWMSMQQPSSDLYVSNFQFKVWADRPTAFWRLVHR